jgi:hypothetical protein
MQTMPGCRLPRISLELGEAGGKEQTKIRDATGQLGWLRPQTDPAPLRCSSPPEAVGLQGALAVRGEQTSRFGRVHVGDQTAKHRSR